jgi:hypothetical protein
MKTVAGALLLAAALAACRGPEVIGALSVRLTGERALTIAGSEREGAQWFIQEGSRSRPLPPPPVTLFPSTILLSPDGRYLAVLSVGEGHPVLDILDLDRLLQGTHGDRSLFFVDPYPGAVELVGWEGSRLKVTSDRPLAGGLDASGRAAGMDVSPTATRYGIDVASGEIRPE